MVKPSILIVGAGAAGLIAAKELLTDFEVTVLEAQERTGGRLRSIQHQGNTIEAGAEFVHGNVAVTIDLLKKADIAYEKVTGEMYRKKAGDFKKADEMTEDWNRLLRKMKSVKEDITLQQLLQHNYPGPENELFRRHVQSYAEGFDLADINKVSVKALYKEWDAEDFDNYRIPAGYSAVVKYLEENIKATGAVIHTRQAVKNVQWKQDAVTVNTESGETYTVNKLLITVPISVLQNPGCIGHIQFSPAIHFNEKAAADIGFGTVIKVVCKFKRPFWQEDAGFILSDEFFPTWWTQLPNPIPLLTGWLGGPKAHGISNETDETILEKALESLAAIYNLAIEFLKNELDHAWVFNWQKEDYALGAYSYTTLQSAVARQKIKAPVDDTIFFAGEALYSGEHPGTVEAAFVSGIQTSALIKKIQFVL
ncbi:MAG: NAD(P)/FAD-dependent oxidoreductase [Ferruginibacter sp.]